MTTATLPQRQAAAPAAVSRPNTTQIGTIVWLSSELMFFAALFAMWFTLRAMVPEQFYEGQSFFTHGFSIVNTIILVLSSVTCQIGVFYAEGHMFGTEITPRKRRTGSILNVAGWGMTEWYVLTFILGAIFVSGQAYEYTHLVEEGIALNSDAFGSIFYLATGFHGLHVLGGLMAFLAVIMRANAASGFTAHEKISAICVSYYWHFVDVVWIGLFFVVYLLDPISGNVPLDLTIF